MARFIIFCLLGLFIVPSYGRAASFNYHHYTLSNGLTLLVLPNHKVPAVSHMVWYKVGAIDEPDKASGLAHFLEHIMFKGTKSTKPGEFSRIISEHGGNDNAFTSFDFTAYFQTISNQHLPMVMRMEAERMTQLQFDDHEIATENPVIQEERNMRVDNHPKARLIEKMRNLLFATAPYARPLIGYKMEIPTLNKTQLVAFYQRYYAPNNAIVVVSGDVKPLHVLKLAEIYYGNIKRKPHINRSIPRFSLGKETLHTSLADNTVLRPQFLRYYLAPSQHYGKTTDSYSLTIAAHLLGGGKASYLHQELVDRLGIAASVSTFYDDLSFGPSIFGIAITPKSGISTTHIEKALDQTLDAKLQEGFTLKEVNRIKTILEAETIYAQDGFKTLGYFFGQILSLNLPPEFANNWLNHILAVSHHDIEQAMKQLLLDSRSVTGYLLPQEEESS